MKTKILKGYEPEAFFRWFEALCAIPHGSRNEKEITDFLVNFAETRDYPYYRDEMHNLLVRVPATEGYEDQPALLLQAHTDMVCKCDEGVEIDFETQPVTLEIVGNMLKGKGTTLGADDLTGVAFMLAMAEGKDIPHPPLELLFTAQEEIGLLGVRAFDKSQITAKRMINFDSGYSHTMCVCSAGASKLAITRSFSLQPAGDMTHLRMNLSGGRGGHSGIKIHVGRACMANLTGELLHELGKQMPVQVSALNTAGASPILSKFSAEFAVPAGKEAEATDFLKQHWARIFCRFEESDPDIQMEISPLEETPEVLSLSDTRCAVDLLYLIHTGALKHHGENPNIIIASSSIHSAELKNGEYVLRFGVLSCDDTIRELLVGRYEEIINLLGCELTVRDAYSGWRLQKKSKLQDSVARNHLELFGRKIDVEYVHGGIEVGIIKGAIPELDAVGISPTSTNAHTTSEVLHLEEVQPFWDLMLRVIAEKQ